MYYYKVKISYKGTRYFGWQAQSVDGDKGEKPTVQGTLQQVLQKMSKYRECTIAGASRTDAGVHAQGQLAKISIPIDLAPEKLFKGMNSLLPNDIRLVKCEACTKEYTPKNSRGTKEYHYYFSTAQVENPALADLIAHVPGPMDLKEMQEACGLFIGEHDFYNFCSRSSTALTTIRTISGCEIRKADLAPLGEDIYYLKISGNGFLRYMIRYIAGALFKLSTGTIRPADISHALQDHREEKLSAKAKSKGLHLVSIHEQTT